MLLQVYQEFSTYDVFFPALIHYRNGQGQCFTNLAFALSQLGDLKKAEIAYHHALLAAKDSREYKIQRKLKEQPFCIVC